MCFSQISFSPVDITIPARCLGKLRHCVAGYLQVLQPVHLAAGDERGLLIPKPLSFTLTASPSILQRPMGIVLYRCIGGAPQLLLWNTVESPEHLLLEFLQGIVPIFFYPLPKLSSSFPATQNAPFLSLFSNTRKPELDREGKRNLDDTGLEIPVYRGNQVIFYLAVRIVTENPLKKSPFPGRFGAGLSVPAARHSAPAGPYGTTAAPCVPRLARRGGTSPGRGNPAAPPSFPPLPRETAATPERDRL